ncbi:ABC transporter ATP-binding protein [bacterium]|nr:MAG: ABC transporter ATP-binding protein [bacterium]
MSLLIVKNLQKSYGSGDSEVKALREATFEVEEGEFVSIMGESGSGKSTLLSILGALNTPTAGNLNVAGVEVYKLGQEKRADFRREFLGFVFQNFRLIPYLTLGENTMLPLATLSISKKEKVEKARKALEHVGLASKMNRLPSQVSGGEQERAAVARAIVNEPPILLADEPTGNLDSRTAGEVMGMLKELNSHGTTVVMVTHSEKCAAIATRHLLVADGVVSEMR